MKKINGCTQFVVGRIYNSIYIGSNDAYAKINGRQTIIIVTAMSSKLQYQVLFDQFGSVFSDELRSGVITSSAPERAFAECELYEIDNKSEWFVKSQFMTLQEALNENLITLDEIKKSPKSGRVVSISPDGFYTSYSVEGKSEKNPYLQRLYVKWSSYKEMEDDFVKYGAL